MDQLREFSKLRHRMALRFHQKLHTGEAVTHIGYCVLVFMEGHGVLSLFALGTGAFAICALLIGEVHVE